MISSHVLKFTCDHILSTPAVNSECLRVVPLGKKSRQKIVVGDTLGAVRCFSLDKRQEVTISYEHTSLGKPVTRIHFLDDRAYVSCGERVIGLTRKGREFYNLTTNLTESIVALNVQSGSQVWVAGSYMLTKFVEEQEKQFTVLPDRIHDICVIPSEICGGSAGASLGGSFDAYVALQDRTVRIVNSGNLAAEIPCEGSVKCLTPFHRTDGSCEGVIYGTTAGVIGKIGTRTSAANAQATVAASTSGSVPHSVLWSHVTGTATSPGATAVALGGITGIRLAQDFLLDGSLTFIVARDTGRIEFYTLPPNASHLNLVHTETMSEAAAGLDVGFITSTERQDLIVNAFSGKVQTLSINTEDPSMFFAPPNASSRNLTRKDTMLKEEDSDWPLEQLSGAFNDFVQSATGMVTTPEDAKDELRKKVALLENELADLEQTVRKQKQRLSREASKEKIVVAPSFTVRDSFNLDATGVWILSIESSAPIECVVVQSNMNVEIVHTDSHFLEAASTLNDPDSNPDSSSSPKTGEHLAMIASHASFSRLDPSSWKLMTSLSVLSLFTALKPTHRFELHVRPQEGTMGTLNFLVLSTQRPQSAIELNYPVKPLSLHQRLGDVPSELDTTGWNSLRLGGTFTASDINAWVALALPGIPETLQKEDVSIIFQSTLLGKAFILCKYKRNEAEFLSNNISSLCILNDVLTREATARNVQIKVNMDYKSESVFIILDLLNERLTSQIRLKQRVTLLKALREIEMQEKTTTPEVNFLHEEYTDTLANADALEKEMLQQPRRLEFLQNIVRKLAMDVYSLSGERITPGRMSILNQCLERYDLKQVKEFFQCGAL